jgi:hypothetical protein
LLIDPLHVITVGEVAGFSGRQRRWRVASRTYQYRLLDRAERELLTYHWQPGAEFLGPDHPHLHVSAALDTRINALDMESIDLSRRHLTTGLVSLGDFVRMLIEEFGVAPVRSDWRDALARAEAALRDDPAGSA